MRSDLIRFVASGLTVLGAFVVLLDAQITVPFPTFTAGTTIQPDEVNQNFAKFADACNRTGCTMTGSLTTRAVLPDGNNTRDLGLTGTRYRDGWFGRDVAIGGTLGVTGAVSFNDTGATALDVAGGITAGTGNVALVGTDGRIPAVSSTYFASLSGASLTGLLEANIADGTVFPRLAANETITGNWTVATTGPVVVLTETDAAADNQIWRHAVSNGVYYLQAFNDALSVSSQPIAITRSGTGITSIELNSTATAVSGSLAVGGGTAVASIISGSKTWDPTALTTMNNETTDVTVTGVQASSPCMVGFQHAEGGATTFGQFFSASYVSANLVRVMRFNARSITIDLDSGTLRVTCFTY